MRSQLPPTTGRPYDDLALLLSRMIGDQAAEILKREALPAEGEVPDAERIVVQRAAALVEIGRARHGG